jgi:colanic acid biosynthesis protein WcaH
MKASHKIPDTDFLNVIKNTPLISIDIIIYNALGEILLGLRQNAPAKNFWFIPGGRILKNESLPDAFSRISSAEFGFQLKISDAGFKGIYEHIYPDENYFEEPGISTHYIVLAYEYKLTGSLIKLPKEQHNEYSWLSIENLLASDKVHSNTKNYFNSKKPFNHFNP